MESQALLNVASGIVAKLLIGVIPLLLGLLGQTGKAGGPDGRADSDRLIVRAVRAYQALSWKPDPKSPWGRGLMRVRLSAAVAVGVAALIGYCLLLYAFAAAGMGFRPYPAMAAWGVFVLCLLTPDIALGRAAYWRQALREARAPARRVRSYGSGRRRNPMPRS